MTSKCPVTRGSHHICEGCYGFRGASDVYPCHNCGYHRYERMPRHWKTPTWRFRSPPPPMEKRDFDSMSSFQLPSVADWKEGIKKFSEWIAIYEAYASPYWPHTVSWANGRDEGVLQDGVYYCVIIRFPHPTRITAEMRLCASPTEFIFTADNLWWVSKSEEE